ncbi:glycosyltransferase [Shewanella frigidimarina]|uniref:glycosyltransferase n=1 Tax=Shewanella frigidimarina TaxID=56812 RepID=UPI003FA15B3F|tara:strand:+ start:4070 stop:5179 length:1110 start_codon:yes stop_codon:yes gene_type:complete
MLNITIVVHNLNGGGAEKMMVRLANGLAALGDNVSLVLLTEGGININIINDNVKLIELKASRTAMALPKLMRYFQVNKPDKVISALTHVNVIAIIACFSLGILNKLFVSERNAFSKDKHVSKDFLINFAYFIAPYLYRIIPNPVVAVSKGVAQDLIDTTIINEKSVTNAPNPVLDDDFLEKKYIKSLHPWLIDKTKPTLVAVGRLATQKGFDILIKAMPEIIKVIDCRLIIFGEGELKSEFEHLIKDLNLSNAIDLAGYVSNPLDEMAQADLFVLSSRFEGSPNVLVEAMSTGVKVLATDCPHGPDEILLSGELGYLVKTESIDSIVSGIITALKYEHYDKANQLKHASKYTITNSASKYRAIITGENP